MLRLKRKLFHALTAVMVVAGMAVAGTNFTWEVRVGNISMVSGTYYKNDGSGGLTTEGASADDFNAHWDGATDILRINDLDINRGPNSWPTAGIYIYENKDGSTFPTSNFGAQVTGLTGTRDITINVSGVNNVTAGATTSHSNLFARFGFHVARWSGHDDNSTTLGTLTFIGDGVLNATGSWSGAFINGNVVFEDSGEYLFEATGANTDVGIASAGIRIDGTCKVTSKSQKYGAYIGDGGLIVNNTASFIGIGTLAGLIALETLAEFESQTPLYSNDDGLTWNKGVFEIETDMVEYNGPTTFFTVKEASGGTVATHIKIDNSDNEAITAAKEAIEAATFAATQSNAATDAAAKSAVEAIIGALSLNGVTTEVVSGVFTAAVSGTSANPNGTDGSYTFTVKLNKGAGAEQTTTTLTLTITASVYTSTLSQDRLIPDVNPDVGAIVAPVTVFAGEFTVGPNPIDRHSGNVAFYWTGRTLSGGTLFVYDASGNVVTRIVVGADALGRPSFDNANRRQIGSWDLTDRRGRPVSEGAYLVRGVLTTADGTRERVSVMIGVK